MKNHFLIPAFTLLIGLNSCVSVLVTQPQPEGVPPLTEFPTRYIGTYVIDKEDTVRIAAGEVWMQGYQMVVNGTNDNDLVIKPFRKDLIINGRDSTLFTLAILRTRGKKHLNMLLPNVQNHRKLRRLEALSKPMDTKKNGLQDRKYIVTSRPDLLEQLYKKKIFSKAAILKRIN